jgi:hypothetical protein
VKLERDGLTAGVAVFDRQANAFTDVLNQDLRFRSASVVKLLIALDHLWDRGPEYDIRAADRVRLEMMLRSSDDDAASYYWEHLDGAGIIDRMVPRLGLTHTAGPPATHPGFWGAGDRTIVAVFTLHPDGTPYGKAYTDLTRG